MARLCEPCRAYTADDAVTACLTCGGPVKFTLLPPVNGDAEPIAGVPTPCAERYGRPLRLDQLPVGILEVVTGLVVVALIAVAGVLLSAQTESFDEREARLEPGISVAAAMEIMGGTRTPVRRFTFSSGDTAMEVFQDIPRPFDDAGEGTLTYQKGGKAVRIQFENGIVTGVERSVAENGLVESVTVMTR